MKRSNVAAIVLAGGRSTRFGGPKLDAAAGGISILDRAIGAVAPLAGELIVAGRPAPHGPEGPPGRASTHTGIRWLPDAEPFGGPLLALAGALRSVTADTAIVVGGDMPSLVPAVLEAMLERIAAEAGVDALVLEAPPRRGAAGKRQVLPLAIRVAPAVEAARVATDEGARSIVRLLGRLRVFELSVGHWQALDPMGRTLLDIDVPEDLERLVAHENR